MYGEVNGFGEVDLDARVHFDEPLDVICGTTEETWFLCRFDSTHCSRTRATQDSWRFKPRGRALLRRLSRDGDGGPARRVGERPVPPRLRQGPRELPQRQLSEGAFSAVSKPICKVHERAKIDRGTPNSSTVRRIERRRL